MRWLADLSNLITGGLPPEDAVRDALPVLRGGVGARDAFLVYGEVGGFGRYGTSPDLELDNTALWAVYRDLTSRKGACAFDFRDGPVAEFRSASTGTRCDYVASLIPMAAGMGEMLVARGPWPRGFGELRLRSLEAALPALALVLGRRLDAKRAERQRDQLSALANISRVLSESGDLETVLTSLASTIATAMAIDYVTIDLVDGNGKVTFRCFNESRPGIEAFRERWKQGAKRPDAARDTVLSTRKPLLFADAPNDVHLPEVVRNFTARTLMRSIGTLPLLTRHEVLGVITVASHTPLEFSAQQVELLEGLAAQTAAAVQAIGVYQELAASKRQLQRLNEQLQESMGVQHHLARADTLTGIPNRRYLDEALESECARASRYGRPLCVVMADLDNLKLVNDQHSHAHGDDVLRHTARIARETCRQADMVGRYGGRRVRFCPASDAATRGGRVWRALPGDAGERAVHDRPGRIDPTDGEPWCRGVGQGRRGQSNIADRQGRSRHVCREIGWAQSNYGG